MTFVVEDVFEIQNRGPVIVRSDGPAREARDRGELFSVGDTICCGDLRARIVGIESFAVFHAPQQGLLLRGVSRDQLEKGQVWVFEPLELDLS